MPPRPPLDHAAPPAARFPPDDHDTVIQSFASAGIFDAGASRHLLHAQT